MTAPTAAETAIGHLGPLWTPRSSTAAAGNRQGAQPHPRMAVLKAARSLRSAMLGIDAICAA
eukprot:14058857-Alexandrium_andersonii.AAC.1